MKRERQTAEADAVEGSVEEADEGEKKRRRKGKRPRLEGEALRDELMRREKEEEAAVLEVNTQFYRARAYKVGRYGSMIRLSVVL